MIYVIYNECMSQVYAIDPNVNGSQFRKDPETGLLYSNQVRGFTLSRKKKFLEHAPTLWPDVTAICQIIGVSKSTYKVHYMHDRVFREECDKLTERDTDRIEAAMSRFALEKGNFMDRIAWLRAHRGEKYNEKKMIQVDVNLTKERIDVKKASLSQAIDPDLIMEADIIKPESIVEKTIEKSDIK